VSSTNTLLPKTMWWRWKSLSCIKMAYGQWVYAYLNP